MNPPPPTAPLPPKAPPAPSAATVSPWDHLYRRLLPAYWMFVFACTHLPRPDIGFVPTEEKDKILHTLGFAPLGFLFWRFAESLHRPVSGRLVWIAWICLATYAALDEYTQQFVGRSTDPVDWLCNMIGISSVLAVLEWRRRKRLRAGPPASSPSVPQSPR